MAKFVDFYSDRDVQDIMEAYLERFPTMFEGFDTAKIGFVTTKKKNAKQDGKKAIKLHQVKYPHNVWLGKVYICEVLESPWKKLDQTKRNLAVFRTMCQVPTGAFDESSKMYGKTLKPDIQMFTREFAAAGGVPNWEENPAAKDPMKQDAGEIAKATPVVEAIPAEDGIDRKAVTNADLASVQPKASKVPAKK